MKTVQAVAVTLIWLGMGGVARAQSSPGWGAPTTPGPGSDARRAMDGHGDSAEMQQRMEKVRQSDRQRKMIADTRRLLNLAAELKTEMEKTSSDPSSSEIIKKADEIERLARSVRERMKG